MSRNIITKKTISALANAAGTVLPAEDGFASKILKLIPADVVSVYLAVFNIIKSSNQNNIQGKCILQWIVFSLVLVITPFYLRKIGQVKSNKQLIFSTFSFIFWVISLGGPLDGQLVFGFPIQFLGAVFLPIYTLSVPLLYE